MSDLTPSVHFKCQNKVWVHLIFLPHGILSDLVYPNSVVPIIMCMDCEICGLLNHCISQKLKEEVIRKCVRIVRQTD